MCYFNDGNFFPENNNSFRTLTMFTAFTDEGSLCKQKPVRVGFSARESFTRTILLHTMRIILLLVTWNLIVLENLSLLHLAVLGKNPGKGHGNDEMAKRFLLPVSTWVGQHC